MRAALRADRAGRPALPAAARPAGARPGRGGRAPRRRRRAAGREVDGAGDGRARARLHAHAGRAGRARAGLRRRGARPRWPGCRTSARSPTASSPTWCGARVAEVAAALDRRERLFREAGIGVGRGVPGPAGGRRVPGRAGHRPAARRRRLPDAARASSTTWRTGCCRWPRRVSPTGVHLAVSATRWTELRPRSRTCSAAGSSCGSGEPSDSEVDRKRAAAVPARARPRAGPGRRARRARRAPAGVHRATRRRRWRAVARCVGRGRRCRRSACCPDRIALDELAARHGGTASRSASTRTGSATVELDPRRAAPAVLRRRRERQDRPAAAVAHGLCERYPPERARIVVVDHAADAARRRPGHAPDRLREHRRGRRRGGGRDRRVAAGAGCPVRRSRRASCANAVLVERPGGVRCWSTTTTWSPRRGSATAHPLLALAEFLPQAKDVGLHVVLARRCGGAGRALFDPVLGRLRELGAPGLVGNGSPDEGALVESVKPAPLPPGRSRAGRPAPRAQAGAAGLARNRTRREGRGRRAGRGRHAAGRPRSRRPARAGRGAAVRHVGRDGGGRAGGSVVPGRSRWCTRRAVTPGTSAGDVRPVPAPVAVLAGRPGAVPGRRRGPVRHDADGRRRRVRPVDRRSPGGWGPAGRAAHDRDRLPGRPGAAGRGRLCRSWTGSTCRGTDRSTPPRSSPCSAPSSTTSSRACRRSPPASGRSC